MSGLSGPSYKHPCPSVPVIVRVAGVAAGTIIRCRPSSLSSVPRREEAGILEDACLRSCSRTDGRSAAQPVGSFVTKASSAVPLKVVSKAPWVVGKSEESVNPVT